MKVFLETERLILRQFTEDDADHLFELDSDREVIRFTNIGLINKYALNKDEFEPETNISQ